MLTSNISEIIGKNGDKPVHVDAVMRELQKQNRPLNIECGNDTVSKIEMPAPGIFIVESKMGDNDLEIISAGIHGNEMSGVYQLDALLHDILLGKITVNKNMLLIYGNLSTMDWKRGGETCGDWRDNLNRLFNQGYWGNPQNYEQTRANTITHYVSQAVSQIGQTIHTDLHQSFDVPTTREVRGLGDDTHPFSDQYDYVVTYPLNNDVSKNLDWVKRNLSHIVAGVAINDMSNPAVYKTFAGYTAALGCVSGTYEMGQIGNNSGQTYAPQIMNAIRARVQGYGCLDEKKQQNFDTWKITPGAVKEDESFVFLQDGKPTIDAPRDFMPGEQVVARQKGVDILLSSGDSRTLFANSNVSVGDRAYVEVAPHYVAGFTNEWMKK